VPRSFPTGYIRIRVRVRKEKMVSPIKRGQGSGGVRGEQPPQLPALLRPLFLAPDLSVEKKNLCLDNVSRHKTS